MDSFEWTKIAAAVLSALLLIFGTRTVIEMNSVHRLTVPVYAVAGTPPAAEAPVEDAAKTGGDAKDAPEATPDAEPKTTADAEPKATAEAAPAAGGDTAALLSKASADNGKASFKKCAACHTYEKGKTKAVGPNLWGIVNRPKASAEGFEYSAALKGKGGNWTFEDLAAFLKSPKGYAPGTKMVFGGISDPADNADLIAYLATLADAPVALPK